VLVALVALAAGCRSEPPSAVRVAAAANVAETLSTIAESYRAQHGVAVEISAGSSGKLAAQIQNGAPFEVFLSADAERPAQLEQKGFGVPSTRFTYAIGRLALCGRDLDPARGEKVLGEASFRHLAIANPETAPYGVAAVQVLERLGAWQRVKPKTVRGENVSQTLQFVESGSAELGLLALSTVVTRQKELRCWTVPARLHDPIRQDAMLLGVGRDRATARSFLEHLRSPSAQSVLRAAGYDLSP
jgi:molybdate transport system substrate-binding protein